MKPKVYLAAPFFNPEQVALVERLEQTIGRLGWRLFSPRKGENAVKMNSMIKALRSWEVLKQIKLGVVTQAALQFKDGAPPVPSRDLRASVFYDNWSNIDDADLLLGVIDDFDVGVMWEVGYAFARHVPIVTHTGRNYGCNLMLAHSIIGHTKTLAEVEDILKIGDPALGLDNSMDKYGLAIAEIQHKYKNEFSLKEGVEERSQ